MPTTPVPAKMSMKSPARDGVAEDAEIGLAHHLRRGPKLGRDGAGDFAAAKIAGDNANLRAHECSVNGASDRCSHPIRLLEP